MKSTSTEDKKAVIGALLFASHGLKIEEICERTKVSEEEALRILSELKRDYELINLGIEVVEEQRFWKIKIKDEFIDKVKEFAKPEIGRGKMETLAVIAWKSPVKQSEIVKMRGNKAYEHIKELFEEGFITMQPFARTFILTLTDKFFEYFNIRKGEEKSLLNRNEINKMIGVEGDKNVET
ncbi:MAG: SMC-Scp complex subunit ScpB [Candidatus Parvarchaeota archaeon]|nr:SMC-Scp complex subunit ScpB [Candidatus Jingweiarchaeum tengchongense]MCW1297870.1 SMC-Scp complex subunit ScpB [Candidatus Jingweiarchaeum tengchongense]MCW1299881.1 SMC-Scp complex subunit ScpB [Candidatus Jingweiarchaeum tengchongense]MCW1305115.1 SMC-Scp complex subunit ScpB [Candidatus Jingweiarchaeum tengchongense]MCW1305177.1 SMC-Scp complex subunit ScpB [Candidatus Jingweiarchaeum tengchongense]